MRRELLGAVVALPVLALLFAALERRWAMHPARVGRRPGLRTDLGWWLVTAWVTRPLGRGVGIAAAVAAAGLLGRPFAPVLAVLPAAAQALLALVLADLLGYWAHRAFHRHPRLWPLHAVHHAAATLDWLASARVHPLNEIAMRAVVVAPLYALGFAPGVLASVVPLLTLWSIALHANLRWRLGPLGALIASPAFHRWHHALGGPASGANFAGLFVVWDRLFGTLHLPDAVPHAYGVEGRPSPRGLWRQLAEPLRRGVVA